MSNTRYQEGSIERVKRAKGPDVWVYRWRESNNDGHRVQKKKVIGDVDRYKTKSEAKAAVDNFRAEINARRENLGKVTVEALWGRFQEEKFPDEDADKLVEDDAEEGDELDEDALSPTTIQNYKDNFKLYVLPEWGNVLLEEVRPFKVQKWLRSLRATKPTPVEPGSKTLIHKPLAPATKAKIRNQMSALFSFAILHDLYEDSNPITPVQQSAKRRRKPDVLTIDQMRALLAEVPDPIHRTAIFIAASTGLRRSENRGLKWADVDFGEQWLHLRRGVIRKMESRLKTEASRAGIPLPPGLGEVLLEWRKQTPYPTDEDWILASPAKNGETPIWLDTVLQRHIQPAAKRAGIKEQVGWHTFRRSLASLMVTMKEHPKVAQELLRHSNPRLTMELYAQADHDSKRAAQRHTSRLFLINDEKKAS